MVKVFQRFFNSKILYVPVGYPILLLGECTVYTKINEYLALKFTKVFL